MSTDLHFCNFCQQSVPQDKVESGDAIKHGGRVVCPTCCDTLLLATAERNDVQKPPSLVVPLVVGFVGWGLAIFAWFSHDQYRRSNDKILEDRRLNDQGAISKVISDQGADRSAAQQADADLQAAVEGLGEQLAALGTQQSEGFAAVNAQLEPLPGLQDAQEATAAAVAEHGTRLGGIDESIRDLRTKQEFIRDELDTLTRIAATAGPPQPQEGEFSAEVMELLAKLEHDDSLVRYEALETLGKHDDVRLAAYVEPLLDDGYEMNRFYAAYALGEMRSLETCGGLIQVLDDDYAFVRKAAYEALQKISGEDHPFDHKAATAEARKPEIDVWKSWWEENDPSKSPTSESPAGG